jgi:predicted transcriptional regulator of viral defense system
MAAVLAYGEGAVLSHRSAAELWGIRDSARSAIDITARRGHARPGIDVHSATTLRPADTTIVDGIPCTTVARTLLDNAEAGDRRALERAIDQAEVLRILDAKAVDDVLDHANGRRGAPLLQDVLATLDLGQTLTKRELEERVLNLCAAAGIPRPRSSTPGSRSTTATATAGSRPTSSGPTGD